MAKAVLAAVLFHAPAEKDPRQDAPLANDSIGIERLCFSGFRPFGVK